MVSTLLTKVGLLYNPLTAGKNGGFNLGSPLLPSREFNKAVSSPHIYAPAPKCTTISRSIADPKIFFPKYPFSYACSTAF